MKVIILAAGEGKRMDIPNGGRPKCLLEINGRTIIERLLKQISYLQIKDITIVVGYKKQMIIDLIDRININVKIVENDNYKKDTNILSLYLALKNSINPFYLFEADCIFENKCFNLIFHPKFKDKSVWYSKGLLKVEQYGGVIKANKMGVVQDLRIINKYESKYIYYNKLIGVMKVGKIQIKRFNSYLKKYCQQNTKQYYHIPWIDNLQKLESSLCDFGDLRVASVNNISEYRLAKEMFIDEAC